MKLWLYPSKEFKNIFRKLQIKKKKSWWADSNPRTPRSSVTCSAHEGLPTVSSNATALWIEFTVSGNPFVRGTGGIWWWKVRRGKEFRRKIGETWPRHLVLVGGCISDLLCTVRWSSDLCRVSAESLVKCVRLLCYELFWLFARYLFIGRIIRVHSEKLFDVYNFCFLKLGLFIYLYIIFFYVRG